MAVGVNQWLKQRWRFEAPTEWLEACVDWLREESPGQVLSGQQLNNQVLEQWLLCDLTEVGAGCLPPDLSQQASVRLTGHYCLQVSSTHDVSMPYYSQLQKLQGTENENVSVTATQFTQTPAVKAGRMLMFDMTDGCQNVRGMEYKQIPGVDANLTPGTKVVISGPILCRLGVLMITKDNWTVLGGEVDSLAENTQVDVLQKTLKEQAEALANPQRDRGNRKKTFEKEQTPNKQSNTSVSNTRSLQPAIGSRPAMMDRPSMASRPAMMDRPAMGSRPAMASHPAPASHDEPPDDFLDNLDPDELDALQEHWEDEDMMLEAARTMNQPQNTNKQNNRQNKSVTSSFQNLNKDNQTTSMSQSTVQRPISNQRPLTGVQPIVIKPDPGVETGEDLFERLGQAGGQASSTVDPSMIWDDDDDFAMADIPIDVPKQVTNTSTSTKNIKLSSSAQVKREFNDFPNDAEDLIIAEQSERKPNVDSVRRPCMSSVTLSTPPYTYLMLVRSSLPYQKYQLVNVKAYVSTLSSRLEHIQGQHWSLSVKLNDGTASIDAELGDEFLASLIGFSATECHTMREQAKYNKDIKLRIASGMRKCQQSLVQMSGLLQLELSPHKHRPTVIQCLPFSPRDVLALQHRLSIST